MCIQSTVATRAPVGNRCAVPALLACRLDPHPLHVVQLPAHYGFGRPLGVMSGGAHSEHAAAMTTPLGGRVAAADLDAFATWGLGRGLPPGHPLAPMGDGRATGAAGGFRYLLTGYLGDAATTRAVAGVARALGCGRQSNAEAAAADPAVRRKRHRAVRPCHWTLDPVLGDGEALYVSAEAGQGGDDEPLDVVAAYRAALPLASLVTPNQLELELLTLRRLRPGGPTGGGASAGMRDEATCWTAIDALHDLGPTVVVLTSVRLPSADADPPPGSASRAPPRLRLLASRRAGGDAHRVSFEFDECGSFEGGQWRGTPLAGTGDLMAALLVACGAADVARGGEEEAGDPATESALARTVGWALLATQRTCRDAAGRWERSRGRRGGGSRPGLRIAEGAEAFAASAAAARAGQPAGPALAALTPPVTARWWTERG